MKLRVGKYYQHKQASDRIIELVATFKVHGGKRIYMLRDGSTNKIPACIAHCKHQAKCTGGCSDEKYLKKNYRRVPDLVGILSI